MSVCNIGYGADLSRIKTTDDAAVSLLTIQLPQGIAECYKEFCCDIGTVPFPVDPNVAKRFVNEYQNDTFCYSGIEGLLVDIINEKENLTSHRFTYEDCCIYVPAAIPANDKDKATLLTQERIETILQKYLPIITDQEFPITWLDINNY